MVKAKIPIVDFHTHLLPFVDHGSTSVEMSESLLHQAEKAGVAVIVATPHYYAHEQSIDSFLSKREKGFLALKEYRRGREGNRIPLLLGAEVALEKDLLSMSGLDRLTIEGTNILLLEMPLFGRWQQWMYDSLYEIQNKFHVNLIMAHVDRYSDENTARLFDMGFMAQVNASAFVLRRERRKMRTLCEEGLVHLLGSDVHDDRDRNYRDLLKARKKMGEDLLSYFYSNSVELLGKKTDDFLV